MRRGARTGIVFVAVAFVVALALAAFASPFASSQPDGLNKVAIDHGFDATARDSATADSPLAEYAVKGVADERVSKGLSGVIGVTLTLGISAALFGGLWYMRRRRAIASPIGAAGMG